MKNVLEFNQFRQEYLTVKVPNPLNHDEIMDVKLNKPTERVNILITNATVKQLEIQNKIDKKENVTAEEQLGLMDLLEDLVYGILNNNRQGLKFDMPYIGTYFGDVENISILIAGMTEFMQEINKRKNLKSL